MPKKSKLSTQLNAQPISISKIQKDLQATIPDPIIPIAFGRGTDSSSIFQVVFPQLLQGVSSNITTLNDGISNAQTIDLVHPTETPLSLSNQEYNGLMQYITLFLAGVLRNPYQTYSTKIASTDVISTDAVGNAYNFGGYNKGDLVQDSNSDIALGTGGTNALYQSLVDGNLGLLNEPTLWACVNRPIQTYSTGITYKQGSIVLGTDSVLYIAITNTVNNPVPASPDWKSIVSYSLADIIDDINTGNVTIGGRVPNSTNKLITTTNNSQVYSQVYTTSLNGTISAGMDIYNGTAYSKQLHYTDNTNQVYAECILGNTATNSSVGYGLKKDYRPYMRAKNLTPKIEPKSLAIYNDILHLHFPFVQTNLPTSLDYRSIAYGNGIWVVIAYNTGALQYSLDNANSWQTSGLPMARDWLKIIYANGWFIAIGENTNNIVRSTNGINWEVHDLTMRNSWIDIAYGNGIWCVIAKGALVGQVSTDNGLTWTATTLPSTLGVWEAVSYGNGYFVMITKDSNRVGRSTNGTNWTVIDNALPYVSDWKTLVYGNDTWVAVAYASNIIASSKDNGLTWVHSAGGVIPALGWNSIAYDAGRFVIVGGINSIALQSFDGFIWEEIFLPSSSNWQCITSGNGKFVAIARNTNIATSQQLIYI